MVIFYIIILIFSREVIIIKKFFEAFSGEICIVCGIVR